MTILFPSDPLDEYRIDDHFREQRLAARAAGFATGLLSYEELRRGRFEAGDWTSPLLLRGWMLSCAEYAELARRIQQEGLEMLVSAEQYQRCHWLPGWLDQVLSDTPETVCYPDLNSALRSMEQLDWGAYFVKDYVKSLVTDRLPIVRNGEELAALVGEMLRYRDELEGGLCLRRVERWQTATECRSFVWNGKPVPSWDDERDVLLARVVPAIHSPFFSVDLVRHEDGRWRLVEIGDGQVSDLKEWTAEALYAALAET